MDRLERITVILGLIEKMREKGSWCGETHIQKAVYFLQEITDIKLSFNFILYKHGPFSFDFRDELTSMRADGLLVNKINPAPYGPTLVVTELGKSFLNKFINGIQEYLRLIEFIVGELANKDVSQLERWATALFVTKMKVSLCINGEAESRAKKIHELKPHLSMSDANDAVANIDRILSLI